MIRLLALLVFGLALVLRADLASARWLCLSGNCDQGEGVATELGSGNVFAGNWPDGEPHGEGRLSAQDGMILYEGELEKGIASGQGRWFYSDESIMYEGGFVAGVPSGVGSEYGFSGHLEYKGEFVDGSRQGEGAEYYPNGNVAFKGSFFIGDKSGFGTAYYDNGNVKYEGQWSNNLENGEGIAYFKDGRIKGRGIWRGGELSEPESAAVADVEARDGWTCIAGNCGDGYGVAEKDHAYDMGEFVFRYEGDWIDGLPSGDGRYFEDGQLTYEGAWLEGQKHGKGVEYSYDFGAGSKKITYEGDWSTGQIHGVGTYFYEDGSRYEGEWQDGSRHGTGTLHVSDSESSKTGVWEYGEFVGAGSSGDDQSNARGEWSCVWGDEDCINGWGEAVQQNPRRSYEGYWADGLPSGNGYLVDERGSYRGGWLAGLQHGEGIYTFDDGELYSGAWKAGKYHGEGVLVGRFGEIKEIGTWEEGYLTETSQVYEDSMVALVSWVCEVNDCISGYGIARQEITGYTYEGHWKDGLRDGRGELIDVASTLRFRGEWSKDAPFGEGVSFTPDGTIDEQGFWVGGLLSHGYIVDLAAPDQEAMASEINQVDQEPPEITMQRGINVVAKARHTVTGQAIDPSGVAIVEVNGKEASLDANGNFSANVLLVPGANEITITAIDAFENTGYRTYSITREANAPAATPKATPQFTRTLTTGDYYALLIGVNEYESSTINDLVEPVKDTEKLGQVLVDNYSFDADNVSQLVNPTRDEILDELDRLAERLTQDDNLLIFYAGHGYWDESRQEGYWLPSDAAQNRRRDWIPNGTIVSAINGIKTQHTLLVSDACFSGGIFKTRSAFNDIPPATEALYDLPSRKAMTSGTLTEVPDKSVFIEYLIKRLENNDNKYSTSQEIFASMRTAVINNSPTEQVPQFGEIRETGDEGGDFIFVRR